jgi:hypothetical protein
MWVVVVAAPHVWPKPQPRNLSVPGHFFMARNARQASAVLLHHATTTANP